MGNGPGSARETALAGVGLGPVGVAAFPARPAARRARPAPATAAATRLVILSMVPPVCRRSPWTVRRRDAGGIGAGLRAGMWPARKFPGGRGATIRSWNAWGPGLPLQLGTPVRHRWPTGRACPHLADGPLQHGSPPRWRGWRPAWGRWPLAPGARRPPPHAP